MQEQHRALLGVPRPGASSDKGGRCRQHKRRLGTSGGDRCVVAATEERRRPRQNCSSVGSLQFDPEAFVKLAGRQTRFYALALRSGPRQVTTLLGQRYMETVGQVCSLKLTRAAVRSEPD